MARLTPSQQVIQGQLSLAEPCVDSDDGTTLTSHHCSAPLPVAMLEAFPTQGCIPTREDTGQSGRIVGLSGDGVPAHGPFLSQGTFRRVGRQWCTSMPLLPMLAAVAHCLIAQTGPNRYHVVAQCARPLSQQHAYLSSWHSPAKTFLFPFYRGLGIGGC